MKKTACVFLFSGILLFVTGQLIHPVIVWSLPDSGHPPLPEVVDGVSFSIALFGILNALLGLFGLLFSGFLDRFTKPRTFLTATGWSVSTAITIHSVLSLLSCFITHPSQYPIRFPVSLVGTLIGLCSLLLTLRHYLQTREDDPYPTNVTFEFGFAILYILPILVILISLDDLLSIL